MACHTCSLMGLTFFKSLGVDNYGKGLFQKAAMCVSADILRPRKQKSVMS